MFKVYYRSNKVQMHGRRRKPNPWPVFTDQIHRNYLFILEPNYFCFSDKFFGKLVLIHFLFYVSLANWFKNIWV